MDQQTTIALLTGGFALAGGLGGVVLSGAFTRRADSRRLRAEDERRWLTDRRTAYAAFLALAESMLREVDGVAAFLPYDGAIDDEDGYDEENEYLMTDGLQEYLERWEEVLQPALGEVQLLASPEVADLADRVSGALMEVTAYIERRDAFTRYYPAWFQAQDLVEVLRNAMRVELGLPAMLGDSRVAGRRSDDWPWLPDRPTRESYYQGHGMHDSPGADRES